MANESQKTASKAATMGHYAQQQQQQQPYMMAHVGGAQTISRSSQLYQHYRQPSAAIPYASLYHPTANSPYYDQPFGVQQQQMSLALRSATMRRHTNLTGTIQAFQQPGMNMHGQQIYHEPSNGYIASAISEHARLANQHKPLCRCRVMYLGSSVPHLSKNGLHGIQEPLKHLYPEEQFTSVLRASEQQQRQPNQTRTTIDISHLSSSLGIDSWLSVWSNGLLLENVDEFGREIRRFFSIESLHYCAAVRYFDTLNLHSKQAKDPNNNNNEDENSIDLEQFKERQARFLPLDAPIFQYPGMLDESHPPVFASIMRRTTGVKVLECHAFICRRDAAANALVRCCTHAYADFLSAKRLSTELNASSSTMHQANYYPHHYQAPMQQVPIGSMTLPSRHRAHRSAGMVEKRSNGKEQQQPTYQVVEAIVNHGDQRNNCVQETMKLETNLKSRQINSIENSAIATSSSSAPSDHSLQSSTTSAADEDNYAIISKHTETKHTSKSGSVNSLKRHSKGRSKSSSSSSRAPKTGSSRSLFDHFQPQPPPAPPQPVPTTASCGIDRLSHSLDHLAIAAAADYRYKLTGNESALVETENQQLQHSNKVKYSLVSRGHKRHSKSMQNLISNQRQRSEQIAQSKSAASSSASDRDLPSSRKQRKASSYSEMNITSVDQTTIGRSSKRRQRHLPGSNQSNEIRDSHRQSANSTSSTETTTNKSMQTKTSSIGACCSQIADPSNHNEQRTLGPSCCSVVGQRQRSPSSSRSKFTGNKRFSDKSSTTSRRKRSQMEAEMARDYHQSEEVMEQQSHLLTNNVQARLPPPMPIQPCSEPYYAPHYVSPQQQFAATAAYYAQPYVPYAAVAQAQPLHDPCYAAHLFPAAAGPPPVYPPPPAPILSQYHHLARMQMAAAARASAQATTLDRHRKRSTSQQPTSSKDKYSNTLATRFRCLSPPVNLLWGEKSSSSKRHSNSTMAEEATSRRTSELFAMSPAAQILQTPELTKLQLKRQSKSSTQLDSERGNESPPLPPPPPPGMQQRSNSSPIVDEQLVVSAKPGFRQQQLQSKNREQPTKARLSWIKRLSLSMGGGSLKSHSSEIHADPSGSLNDRAQVAREETQSEVGQHSESLDESEIKSRFTDPDPKLQEIETIALEEPVDESKEKTNSKDDSERKRRRGFFSGKLTLGRSSAPRSKKT